MENKNLKTFNMFSILNISQLKQVYNIKETQEGIRFIRKDELTTKLANKKI